MFFWYLNQSLAQQQTRKDPTSAGVTHRFELLGPGGFLRARVDVLEPGDGLVPVLPALPRLQLHQLLGHVSGEETPPDHSDSWLGLGINWMFMVWSMNCGVF